MNPELAKLAAKYNYPIRVGERVRRKGVRVRAGAVASQVVTYDSIRTVVRWDDGGKDEAISVLSVNGPHPIIERGPPVVGPS